MAPARHLSPALALALAGCFATPCAAASERVAVGVFGRAQHAHGQAASFFLSYNTRVRAGGAGQDGRGAVLAPGADLIDPGGGLRTDTELEGGLDGLVPAANPRAPGVDLQQGQQTRKTTRPQSGPHAWGDQPPVPNIFARNYYFKTQDGKGAELPRAPRSTLAALWRHCRSLACDADAAGRSTLSLVVAARIELALRGSW